MKIEFNFDPVSSKTTKIDGLEIILYPSAESAWKESWGGEDIDGTVFGFTDKDGSESEMDLDEICRNIESCGVWGFADREGVIHAWVDFENADMVDILSFFCHEIGHLQRPFKKDDLAEEMKAEQFSDVAKYAWHIIEGIKNSRGGG